MSEAGPTKHPEGLFSGRLEGISFPDLVWAISGRGLTGTLRVRRAGFTKSVYLDAGRIVFAASTDPDDRLGEQFLRNGLISLADLEAALGRLHTGKRLGTLLVESGSLAAAQLAEGVLAQVREIVLDLFAWEEGTYQFDEGPLPTREVITLDMKTGEILLQGIRRIRSLDRIRRSVGGPRAVYGLSETWRQALDGLELADAEGFLVERLREGDCSVHALCEEVFLSNFEVYQTLWGLKVMGVVRERERRPDTRDAISHEGRLAAGAFPALLVALCGERRTGVLYVSRGHQERTFHLREGRCVFATSGDHDDSLIAFLLRRGVISLRDREETARRLLSNKRVGTILRELGVIDGADLRAMVRQQLSEIVYDTFLWEEGDYAFLEGELPSIEEITLDIGTESLVVEGLRRTRSWRVVRAGCGELDTGLELSPTYLDVLDATGAGPEEWQVVAALREPQTLEAVCRGTRLPDFRVCQTIWALRLLGAVRVCEIAEAPAASATVADPVLEAATREEPVRALEPTADDSEPSDAQSEPAVFATPDAPPVEPSRLEVDAGPLAEPDAEEPAYVAAPPAPPEDLVEEAHESEEAREPAWESDEPTAPPAPRIDPEETQYIPRDTLAAVLGHGVDSPRDAPAAHRAAPVEEAPGDDDSHPPEEASPLDPVSAILDEERPLHAPDEPPRAEVLTADAAEPHEAATAEAMADDEGPTARIEVGPPIEVEPAVGMATAEEPGEPDDADAEAPAAEPEWVAPEGLDEAIRRFNAIQRVLYRVVRSEIGAGAGNFLRSCLGAHEHTGGHPLGGAELKDDGSWDTESLRDAAKSVGILDPWPEYRALVKRELEQLRMHIGNARVDDLVRQVREIDPGAADGQGTEAPPR